MDTTGTGRKYCDRAFAKQIRIRLLTEARYVNFAYGDETNDVVYDTSTPRLRQLKAQYDPQDIFDQWFNIVPPNKQHLPPTRSEEVIGG